MSLSRPEGSRKIQTQIEAGQKAHNRHALKSYYDLRKSYDPNSSTKAQTKYFTDVENLARKLGETGLEPIESEVWEKAKSKVDNINKGFAFCAEILNSVGPDKAIDWDLLITHMKTLGTDIQEFVEIFGDESIDLYDLDRILDKASSLADNFKTLKTLERVRKVRFERLLENKGKSFPNLSSKERTFVTIKNQFEQLQSELKEFMNNLSLN